MNPFDRSWVHVPRPDPDARLRLFCFPYAGAGASVFRAWPDLLPAGIEVNALQPPGREGRLKEPPLTSMAAVVAAAVSAIRPRLDRPFALFGHSMGALVAYEVARAFHDGANGSGSTPARLFVSGHGGPHLPWSEPVLHDVPDEQFMAKLRSLEGTPAEVLDHPELMGLLLPLLRADFQVCETYVHQPGPPLACPISAFGGLNDHVTSRAQLQAWEAHTTGGFLLRMIPGGHFFLNERPDLLLRAVASDLVAAARPG